LNSVASTAAPRRGTNPRALLIAAAWVVWAAALTLFAAQDVGLQGQYLLGAVALAGLAVLHIAKPKGALRVLLMLIVVFVSVRYFAWRTLYTIPPVDSAGFLPGLLLYLAELQGVFVYVLGTFVNIMPVERAPVALPENEDTWPTVDVLVPSYNEDSDLLRVTLTAASQIRYAEGKLNVYLLDDGGTVQKRNDSDARKSAAAWARHEELQVLCAELGVGYLTRERNEHAKAGNINAALRHTEGDLILILDADHVPTQDILERTAGYFLKDPDLFLVQTPHFFINPDPLERNLGTFDRLPSENEMFYSVVQKGLDSWNASFFCGSAAVLRRAHLMEVGGIAGMTITEDAETALELHSRGYKSLYIDQPMVAGLQPDTFSGFITQRIRWAQGMMQILLLKNPLWKRGLSFPQRLCYLSSSSFWLFPFARLVFLLAPLFYLFFGLKVFVATMDEFLAFAVFHVVCSLMMSNWLFGRYRAPFVSDLYELLQAVFTFGALLSVIRNPRKPEFKVTPKAEDVSEDFISQLARPFVAINAVLLVATVVGVWRWHAFPLEREHLALVLGWNTVNIVLAVAALGVTFERGRARVFGTIPRCRPVNFVTAEGAVRATLIDTTTEEGTILLGAAALSARRVDYAVLQTQVPGREEVIALQIHVFEHGQRDGKQAISFRYLPQTDEDRADLVRLCYGDSAAWSAFQAGRQRRHTIIGTLAYLFLLGTRRSLAMIAWRRRANAGAGMSKPATATQAAGQ
jgi:cellulose synthase (UDP-forming)